MNLVGTGTLLRRETSRVFRIWRQSFLPVAITTYLYFVVFGYVLGERIGDTQGVAYALFIAPGLMMMSVVTNSYVNSSFSVFSEKYHQGFLELLSAPMSDHAIIFSFAMGSVVRGFVTGCLVFAVSCCFVSFEHINLFATVCVLLSSSLFLSLTGVVNGLMAQSFDATGFVPSFILAPLTFLGGVFFPTGGLSGIWRTVADYNPLAVMCQVYRSVMLGLPLERAWWFYVLLWLFCSLLLWGWAWYIMNRSTMVRN